MYIKLKFQLSIVIVTMMIVCSCEEDKELEQGNNEQGEEPFKWSQMTCDVDGIQWGDCKKGWFGPINNISGQILGNGLKDFSGHEQCSRFKDTITFVYFKLVLNDTGTYQLNEHNLGIFGFLGPVEEYRTDSLHTGTLNITYYEETASWAFIDGCFEFEGYNAEKDSVITITNGQFTNIRLN